MRLPILLLNRPTKKFVRSNNYNEFNTTIDNVFNIDDVFNTDNQFTTNIDAKFTTNTTTDEICTRE